MRVMCDATCEPLLEPYFDSRDELVDKLSRLDAEPCAAFELDNDTSRDTGHSHESGRCSLGVSRAHECP